MASLFPVRLFWGRNHGGRSFGRARAPRQARPLFPLIFRSDRGEATASAPEDRRVDLVFGPAAAGGGYGLEAASGDAGGLFRAFDFVDTMQGGRLSLTARGPGRWSPPIRSIRFWAAFPWSEAF